MVKAGPGKAAFKSAIGAALAMGVLGAGQAQALTISLYNSFNFNNKQYRTYLADEPITWTAARSYAQSLEGAYDLASINNAEENAAIFANINYTQFSALYRDTQPRKTGPWIGLFQQGQTCEPGTPAQGSCGGWTWVDGTTVYSTGYTNWVSTQEPNNASDTGGPEDYVRYVDGTPNSLSNGWNDTANDPITYSIFKPISFVVEEGVPAPGPLPLFGAITAFGFSRKLRKRIKDSKAVGGSITVD